MLRRSLHTVAALAVTATLSATLVAAEAPGKPSSAGKRPATAKKVKRVAPLTLQTHGGPVRVTTTTALDVEVAPTGDGRADEETCQGFESNMDIQGLNLQQAMKDGDALRASMLSEALDNLEDMAMDAGCFVVY